MLPTCLSALPTNQRCDEQQGADDGSGCGCGCSD